MDAEKIYQGNVLIAKFMGWELITPEMRKQPDTWKESYWEQTYDYEGSTGRSVLCSERHLKYYYSWDHLMPVFHKITKQIYDQPPVTSKEGMYATKLYTMHLNNSIESVWLAVLDYIIWYNEEQMERS